MTLPLTDQTPNSLTCEYAPLGPKRFPDLFWRVDPNGVEALGYASEKDQPFAKVKITQYAGLTACTMYGPEGESVSFKHRDPDVAINRAKWASAQAFHTLERALEGFDEATKDRARVALDRMRDEGWTLSSARADIHGEILMSFHQPTARSETRDGLGNPIKVEFVTVR